MKVFKRIISFVISASLLCTVFVPELYAADEAKAVLVLYENFDLLKTGEAPKAQGLDPRETENTGSVRIAEMPSADDKSVYLKNTGAESQAFIQKVFDAPLCGNNVTIGFKVNIEKLEGKLSLPSFRASDKTECPTLRFDDDGNVYAKNGDAWDSIMAYKTKKWYEIKMVLDLEKGSYTVYIDGKNRLKNAQMSKAMSDLYFVRFHINKIDASMYLDDFMFAYGGDITVEEAKEYSKNESVRPDEGNDETGDGQVSTPLITSDADMKIISEIIKDSVAMAVGSGVSYVNCEKKYIDENSSVIPVIINDRTMVPVRFISENFGMKADWNDAEKQVTLSGDKTIVMHIGSLSYTVNGEEKMMDSAPVIINDRTFLPLRVCAENVGKKVYWNDIGLIIIGENENPFDSEIKAEYIDDIYKMVYFRRPQKDEIIADLNSISKNEHPRILLNQTDVENMKQLIVNNVTMRNAFERIKSTADSMLDTEPAQYSLKEVYRLGPCVTTVPSRLENLSLMYLLTDDERYAKRAAEEMMAVCSYPDWNANRHYLDTGGILQAMAIGYDWCYKYLTDEQKDTIENAIVKYGLDSALLIYKKQYDGPNLSTFWITSNHNWNTHCNAGIVMAALAVADKYEKSGELVSLALRSFEYVTDQFDPDGGWMEGPSYWTTTVKGIVKMLAALDKACGTEYGYFNIKGLDQTCFYPEYITGPGGTFNYSDGGSSAYLSTPELLWMAHKLGSSEVAASRIDIINSKNACTVYDLIYYDASLDGEQTKSLPLDKHFINIETATMRSSYSNSAIFAGFHSGDNGANHSHYDTGTFILDAQGERWFHDLGTDRITYTGTSKDLVYRTRTEGHNGFILLENQNQEIVKNSGGLTRIFYEDFEEAAEGIAPASLDCREGGSGKTRVVYNGGKKYLRLSCEDTVTGTQAFVQNVYTAPLEEEVSIEFSVMFEKFPEKSMSIAVIRDSDKNETPLLYFEPSGEVTARDAGAVAAVGEYKVNTWYDFIIDLNLKNKTHSVSFNGKKIVKNAELSKEIKNIIMIRYPIYARTETICLDNLAVYNSAENLVSGVKIDSSPEQEKKSKCKIQTFVSKPKGAFAVSDITEAYKSKAVSALRGVGLFNNRSYVVVRDEIKTKKPYDYYWFAHTKAEIQLSENKKSAVLSQNGKELMVKILSDVGTFEIADAKPLPSSPNPSGQETNADYKKLSVYIPNASEINLSVAFIPIIKGQEAVYNISEIPLSSWSVEDGEIETLDGIEADGKVIDGFDPNTFVYTMYLPEGTSRAPEISAVGADAQIIQASAVGEAAQIKLNDTTIYYVLFEEKKVLKKNVCGVLINEEMITSKSVQEEENPPKNIIDGSLETRFAAEGGGEWIQVDLGETKTVDSLKVAFMKGNERVYKFDIDVSLDGENFTTVYSGENKEKTEELVKYDFAPVQARYIRIIGYGNSVNNWNSITEIE